MNDASATSHDGTDGPSWTVDSLGIGGPLDHYCVTYFLTEIQEFEELYFVVRVSKGNHH